MRKQYVCRLEQYDYFSGYKSTFEKLGETPKQALENHRALKSTDYDFGDSYQKTEEIQVIWIAEKVVNNHNFFTHPYKRLQKIQVISWDGSVIDHVITSEKELHDNQQKINEMGYYYNIIDNTIRSFEPITDSAIKFDFDDEDDLIF